MNTTIENLGFDNISLDDLKRISPDEAEALLETVESNTEWKDAEKNMMRNGAKMFGC